MKQRLSLLTLVSLLSLPLLLTRLLGCGSPCSIRKLTESSVVLAFGDSLTAGIGAGQGEDYPSRLAPLIGCRVVNAGIAGENSTEGLKRLPALLKRERPDLVILCHGGNDRLQQRPEPLTKANLAAMIAAIRDAGADVILIGVPRRELRLRLPPLYEELAEQHGIPLEADIVPRLLRSPGLKSDRIHPNAAGYQQLAQSLSELIQASTRCA